METHVHLHFLLLTFLKSVQKLHYIWTTAELQEMIKGIRVLDGNHSCSSRSRPFESKSWWWTWEEELLWTGSLIWRYCEEKKDVNLSEMCCFFPQDSNYCPASVNPSWIICFPRTPTDKLTKRQPKLEALKVGPAPREASCLHGNPPIPKMMTRHPIPSPSVDKETGSGGLNTRQQQQEGLNTKYNTALLPPPPPPSVYFIFCLSLPSRQLWLVNICRGSNLYLRKHREEELMLDY